MIPFQLHRRIPRPAIGPHTARRSTLSPGSGCRRFYQRDQAREEVSRLAARVAQLEAERTAATAVTSPERPALLRHFGLQPDDWLIDVGCGSGRLVKPLAEYSTGKYSGFDVVSDLVAYAQQLVARVDWRFDVVDHISIPEPDGCADMVCFFSVLTHLLHEQSYWYLEEAVRVLKPKGKIVFSFLDFSEPAHWPIFIESIRHSKQNIDVPMNVFIAKEAIYVWARHLGAEVEAIVGAQDAVVPEGALGQSICVLRKP